MRLQWSNVSHTIRLLDQTDPGLKVIHRARGQVAAIISDYSISTILTHDVNIRQLAQIYVT